MNNTLNKVKNNKNMKYLLIYSIIFVIMVIFLFLAFWIEHKSFIWNCDGYAQHYPSLVYIGQYIRSFFINIFHGNFSIKMWDFNLGFGSDILQTLNYYSFGDPLDLLSVFFSSNNVIYLYSFLCLFRIYLAGLSFYYLCSYMNKKPLNSLLGTFCYTFSGFVMYWATEHPFFINPLIYLPLLLVGLDKLLTKKKSLLFQIMVTISIISNFYFFYMLTIMCFIYALVRFFTLNKSKKNRMKLFFNAFFRVLFQYILGILCAAVIFIPVLLLFLDTARAANSETPNLIHYSFNYYTTLITQAFNSNSDFETYFYTCIGTGSISVISMIILFMRKGKKLTPLKIFTLICFIFLIFPLFGYALNGFSYISNRWVFALTLLNSYIVVVSSKYLFSLTSLEKKVLISSLAVFTIFIILFNNLKSVSNIISLAFFAESIILILILSGTKVVKINHFKPAMLLVLILIESVAQYNLYFNKLGNASFNNYIPNSHKYADTYNTSFCLYDNLKDNSLYRVNAYDAEHQNYGIIFNKATTSYFFSMIPSEITNYSIDLGNAGLYLTFKQNGFDNRTILSTLSSTKYISIEAKKVKSSIIPYGFEKVKSYYSYNKEYFLYENKYYLPLMYGYDSYITKKTFDKLTLTQKENALLEGVVLDKENNDFKKTKLTSNDSTLLCKDDLYAQISQAHNSNILVKDDKIIVFNDNTSVPINFNCIPNSEIYLNINDMNYKSINVNKEYKSYLPAGLNENDPFNKSFYGALSVSCGKKYNSISYLTHDSLYYSGITDSILNLGYNDSLNHNTCTLIFNNKGIYTFKDLSLVSNRLDNYKDNISSLKELEVNDIKLDNNTITANVSSPSEKMLCISIPYSSGWKAYVNGKETKITKANIMNMMIPVKSGTSKIELKYCTPGIKLGLIITLISVIFTILIHRYNKKINIKNLQ